MGGHFTNIRQHPQQPEIQIFADRVGIDCMNPHNPVPLQEPSGHLQG